MQQLNPSFEHERRGHYDPLNVLEDDGAVVNPKAEAREKRDIMELKGGTNAIAAIFRNPK